MDSIKQHGFALWIENFYAVAVEVELSSVEYAYESVPYTEYYIVGNENIKPYSITQCGVYATMGEAQRAADAWNDEHRDICSKWGSDWLRAKTILTAQGVI